MTLARKISIFSGILAIFTSLGIGTAAIVVSRRTAEATVGQSLAGQAEMGAKIVRDEMSSQLFELQGIAGMKTVASMKWADQKPLLAQKVDELDCQDLGVVDMAGTARYALSEETADLSDRDYIKKALKGGKAVSDVIISRITKKPAMILAVPIAGKGGEPAGALIERKDAEMLSRITDPFGFGKTGYAYIVNREGCIVAHKDRSLVLDLYNPIAAAVNHPELQSLSAAFSKICSGTEGSVEYDFRGKRIVSGYAPVVGMNWSIAVTADEKELMSGIALLVRMIAAGAALFLVSGIVGAVLIGRALARPVESMLPVLETISSGDLTRRLEVSSSDEFGAMSEHFNTSIHGLSEIVASAKTMTGKMDGIVDELSAQMTETAASMTQIASGIAAIKERTTSQAASVTQSHEAVKEIRAGIERHDELVGKQAAAVAEASAAIEEMIANVRSVAEILDRNSGSMQSTFSASEQGREGIEQVSAIIEGVAQDSEGLVEASDVIQSVASRTNLLAMNAAIEAAHAGEFGKGFAVVADEIRSLAESSAEQGKVISAVLENLRQRIAEAAELSARSRDQFVQVLAMMEKVRDQEAAIKGAMDEELAGNAKVLESIGDIRVAMSEVEDTSKAMLDGSGEVLAEIGRMTDSALEISGGMDEMAASAKQIDVAVKEVNEGTRRTRDSVSSLSAELSKFKV